MLAVVIATGHWRSKYTSMQATPLTPSVPRHRLVMAMSGSAVMLAACAGSTLMTGAPTGSTSVVSYSGIVSDFGSVLANGFRSSVTDTSAANDAAGRFASALPHTLVAREKADAIGILGGVRGAVTAVDLATQTLVVAGQRITVNAHTVFEGWKGAHFDLPTIQNDLSAQTPVFTEVYGVADEANGFMATRIEEKNALASGYAVIGKVMALNPHARTIELLRKDGTQAAIGYANGQLWPAGAARAQAQPQVGNAPAPVRTSTAASDGPIRLRGVVTTMLGPYWTVADILVDVSHLSEVQELGNTGSVRIGDVVKLSGAYSQGVLVARSMQAGLDAARAPGGSVKLQGVVSQASPASLLGLPAAFDVQGTTVRLPRSIALPSNGSQVSVVASPVNGVLTVTQLRAVGAPTVAEAMVPRQVASLGFKPRP